jgi:hypothetical protein
VDLQSNSVDLAADIVSVDLCLQSNSVDLAADILSVDLQSNSVDLAADIVSVDLCLQSNFIDLAADILSAAVNAVTVQDIPIIFPLRIYFFIRTLVYRNIAVEEKIIAIGFIRRSSLKLFIVSSFITVN